MAYTDELRDYFDMEMKMMFILHEKRGQELGEITDLCEHFLDTSAYLIKEHDFETALQNYLNNEEKQISNEKAEALIRANCWLISQQYSISGILEALWEHEEHLNEMEEYLDEDKKEELLDFLIRKVDDDFQEDFTDYENMIDGFFLMDDDPRLVLAWKRIRHYPL